MSGDFTPEQKRYLEGFVSGLAAARAARGADKARGAAAEPTGPDAIHLKAQDRVRRGGRQARRPGEVQARAASVRRLCAAEGAGGEERAAEARGQFPLALLRPVLRGAGAELLHVPAAHSERHPHALAVRRRRRSRRALRRRLRARHHARQPADPRDRAEERRRGRRGHPGARPAARAAPAPTTSATSPARRPPASIRRS